MIRVRIQMKVIDSYLKEWFLGDNIDGKSWPLSVKLKILLIDPEVKWINEIN